jgi:hypothetical protein
MADDLQRVSQSATEAVEGMRMSLSDMIAGMIQATIDADQAVTDDYLETFNAYAFETDSKGVQLLQMVEFEMTDNEGVRRTVSIPKLSLLPLPVLHVSEATFDIDAQLSVRQSKQKEVGEVARKMMESLEKEQIQANKMLKVAQAQMEEATVAVKKASNDAKSQAQLTRLQRQLVEAKSAKAQAQEQADRVAKQLDSVYKQTQATLKKDAASRFQVILGKPLVEAPSEAGRVIIPSGPLAERPADGPKNTVKDMSEAESTINARIHIELRPSLLPNGMRDLLKVAETSVQEIIKK